MVNVNNLSSIPVPQQLDISHFSSDQLIPIIEIEINGKKVPGCDARQLYDFLNVTTRFADWIKRRLKEYSFEKSLDYVLLKNEKLANKGIQRKIDYHLTLDTAKELAMVERNEQGRKARRYFLACEKLYLENQFAHLQKATPKIDWINLAVEDEASIPENTVEMAEYLNCTHGAILMAIRELKIEEQTKKYLFYETTYKGMNNCTCKMYEFTWEGFMLLCMRLNTPVTNERKLFFIKDYLQYSSFVFEQKRKQRLAKKQGLSPEDGKEFTRDQIIELMKLEKEGSAFAREQLLKLGFSGVDLKFVVQKFEQPKFFETLNWLIDHADLKNFDQDKLTCLIIAAFHKIGVKRYGDELYLESKHFDLTTREGMESYLLQNTISLEAKYGQMIEKAQELVQNEKKITAMVTENKDEVIRNQEKLIGQLQKKLSA